MEKYESITFRITAKDKVKLQDLADREKRTLSNLMTIIISEWLEVKK